MNLEHELILLGAFLVIVFYSYLLVMMGRVTYFEPHSTQEDRIVDVSKVDILKFVTAVIIASILEAGDIRYWNKKDHTENYLGILRWISNLVRVTPPEH